MNRSDKAKDDHCCPAMSEHIAGQEVAIEYVPKFREYGIDVLDGGSSFIVISFCPWCGRKLPDGLRDKWFAILDEMQIEPEQAPREMSTDQWWKDAYL